MNPKQIVDELLETEGAQPPLDAKQYFLAGNEPFDAPEVLNRFKKGAKLYIKWIDKPEPDIGHVPDHREDLRAINRAKSFHEVEMILAKYDREPHFLYMVSQGYFV